MQSRSSRRPVTSTVQTDQWGLEGNNSPQTESEYVWDIVKEKG